MPSKQSNASILRSLVVPEHLKPFIELYNGFIKDGWFLRMDKALEEMEKKDPQPILHYGRLLIRKTVNEPDYQNKERYYQALSVLIDYLNGVLK